MTDGTLGLLSRSLPNKTTSYLPEPNNLENSKSPNRQSISSSTNDFSNTNQAYNFDNNTATNGTSAAASGYIPADGQLTHQQTPYPTATQYSTYQDPNTNSSTLAYTPQETHNYGTYPGPSTTTDAVEAPLLAAFAAQASQVASNTWGTRPSPHTTHSGSQAWQQWTSTMAGSLEPQDCYSASALMQLGGRDLGNGDGAQQTSGEMTMAAGATAGVLDHAQVAGQMTGGTWPLNIFDIGQHGS